MTRLNQVQLDRLPSFVRIPQYARDKIAAGIVHLGIGAFHRAHQAFYTEAALNQFGGDWGIIGCSLRSAGVREQLAPQDGLYTLVERGSDSESLQVIGAVKDVMVGPENPAALVTAMASSAIRIVSLTVTEKGYCHNPATGDLNMQHPDIIHDLEHPDKPKSAVGYIVAALKQRRDKGIKSFTAMSCDNLPENGEVLEKVVVQYAEQIDISLAAWIQKDTRFPSTMIDRIVPATTDEDRAEIEAKLGLRDQGVVLAEPFAQWVIQDSFSDGRPQWETVGALLVDDVRVFEKMKLRLLNGSHSTLAYCGYLSGFDTISEVMREPAFVRLVTTFMEREAGETLAVPAGFDVQDYQRQLRERFSNSALKHRTWQIAMDGSQKLPQRLLETLREQLAGCGHIDILCLAVAAWIRYVSGVDEKGQPIEVSDPLAAQLRAACDANRGNAAAMARAVISMSEVFGDDLIDAAPFVDGTSRWLQSFYDKGVLATVRDAFGAA
jgi:fructuronate reductase